MHLDKYLIKNGYGTKEIVHQYILENKIKINNIVINDFHYEILDTDKIEISNDIHKYKEYIYLKLYKPSGLVSASKDEQNKTIMSLLDKKYLDKHLNIVGRLDKDVEGLILLTNNNKLYKYLINPNNHIKKEYLVTFSGNKDYIDQDLSKGIILDNGYKTLPIDLKFISSNQALITIYEGKFHEIKNIFSTLHMKVIELKRLKINNLALGNLSKGEYISLSNEEIKDLTSLIK